MTDLSASTVSSQKSLAEAGWRQSLASAVRSFDVLSEILDLPLHALVGAAHRQQAHSNFPLLVPRSFVARMSRGNPLDPLLLQVMAQSAESLDVNGFVVDAVGDLASRTGAGLLQKYHGRALLMVTGNCAVHCRYCFRRHYPYNQEPRRLTELVRALDPVRSDSTITEIILSGGDPLLVSDEKLEGLLMAIGQIPHIKRVRIHSRLPVVLPNRITDRLIGLLKSSRLRTFLVVHANHVNELQHDCRDAIESMVSAGIPVLNQSVLLAGVNDTEVALTSLCERLIDMGVIPYYLHLLDRVSGASHFEVPESKGRDLIAALRRVLPGYAVPRLVREVAGAPSKTAIG